MCWTPESLSPPSVYANDLFFLWRITTQSLVFGSYAAVVSSVFVLTSALSPGSPAHPGSCCGLGLSLRARWCSPAACCPDPEPPADPPKHRQSHFIQIHNKCTYLIYSTQRSHVCSACKLPSFCLSCRCGCSAGGLWPGSHWGVQSRPARSQTTAGSELFSLPSVQNLR